MQRRTLLLTCAMLALGCGTDERPADWGYLHEAIIRPSCATVSCHTGNNATAELRLEDPDQAYANLTGLPCGKAEARPSRYLVPGEPARSRLIAVLRGSDITMPPDRLLPLQDVELIEEWISGGAPCE
jgi:hypothetical protein